VAQQQRRGRGVGRDIGSRGLLVDDEVRGVVDLLGDGGRRQCGRLGRVGGLLGPVGVVGDLVDDLLERLGQLGRVVRGLAQRSGGIRAGTALRRAVCS
jgi:hypothetical protein